MALISRNELDQYLKARRAIATNLKRAVKKPLEDIDMTDVAAGRDATIALLNRHLVDATNASATLASELYNLVRERAIGEPTDVDVYSGYNPEALDGAIRAIAQKEVNGNHTAYINECMNRCDYEVQKAAGECIYHNGYKDNQRVRFMRVPRGSETCPFCVMLASRGAVYYSRDTAGARRGHYHSNCDCEILPVFFARGQKENDTVEGHDPKNWLDKYHELRDAGVLDADDLRKASDAAKRQNGRSANRTKGTDGTRFPTGTKAMVRYINDATTQAEFERRAVIVFNDYQTYWKDKRQWSVVKRAIDRKEASFN